MKKFTIILIAFSILAIAQQSCKKENEEDLNKIDEKPDPNACDTANISFKNFVYPLIDTQCNGCHNANVQSGSINLDGYDNLKIHALNGRLFGSINHDAGFKAMPPTGVKLANCDIQKIKAWIDAGAANN